MWEEITIYTIGFGRRRVDQLICILQEHNIQVVIDARTEPATEAGSTTRFEDLRLSLEEEGLEYHWAGRQLGGNRLPRANSINSALDDELRGFADFMASTEFHIGLRQLVGIAGKRPAALLFSAKHPEKCHRRLIADALMMKGLKIVHLIEEGQSRQHELTPELRRDSSELVYNNVIPQKNLH